MRIASMVVAVALGLSATASGQSNKWYDPYQKGKKAFEDGKYQEAVTQLEGAVRADPRAGSYKLVEGVFHVDYFPYYYLALAYLKLQQFDKAQQNIDKARGIGLPQTLAKNLADAESEVKVAVNATGSRGAPQPPAPRSAAFDGLARQAESSLNSKQYDAAIKQLDQLKALDAAEYTRAGLQAQRDEAVKSFSGQLFDEGRALSQRSRFNDAKAKFQQADQVLSGQKPVADALAEIKRREDDYQRLKTMAQTDFANKNYPSARDLLKQAQSAHPEQFADDNLAAQLGQVTRLADASTARPLPPMPPKPETPLADPKVVEGQRFVGTAKQFITQGKYPEAEAQYASALRADPKNQEAIDGVEKARKFKTLRDQSAQLNESHNYPAAQQRLVDARNLDPARFEREGLTSALDALAKSNGAQPSKLALQQALLALLAGDAQKSIAILEPALAGGVEKAAPLHAYLGVAYATQALSALKSEDQTRLRQKAVEQFRLAASAQPGYRLSDRVVSPTIIQMYEQARR